jgi:hypothetical protein
LQIDSSPDTYIIIPMHLTTPTQEMSMRPYLISGPSLRSYFVGELIVHLSLSRSYTGQ